MLLLLSGVVLLAACEAINGTPMKRSEFCRYMPSKEECQHEADRLITDDCLKTCVITQCSTGQNVCAADTMAQCAKRTSEVREETKNPNATIAGYVPPPELRGQTCTHPYPAVNWCQVSQPQRCQVLTMLHERAHACGWKHNDGQGVPGDEGGKGVLGCKFD